MRRPFTVGIAMMLLTIAGILAIPAPASAADKLLGSFELGYDDAVSPDNAFNAALATNMLNGTLINPGQTFSFNKTVGMRTPAKGFRVAMLSTRSKTPAYGYGGGVCMTASILLQAVKAAHLPVLERHNHVSDPVYVPLGEDAAISWGVEDFRFQNNLLHPVMISTNTENRSIRFEIYARFTTPTILLNEEKMAFQKEPFILDGTTYVPLVETAELLNPTGGENDLLYKEISSTVATRFYEGVEYVPIRKLTAMLNNSLVWDGERMEIRITPL